MAQQIRFKINQCLEFGIIEKWSRQVVGIYVWCFTLLLRAYFNNDEEMIAKIKEIFSYQKENISLDDYMAYFKILILDSPFRCLL